MSEYRIPEMARKYVEYDMIRTYTDLPEFPDFRARLLHAFLEGGRKTALHSELYALVVSLVQMGLDTHDMIDTEGDRRPEKEMRSRQLKVLAGDYFSSRFYHLLSQAGQIDMIRRISGAVCEVNRRKMMLYERMKQLRVTAEDYFAQCVRLKSELFAIFDSVAEERVARVWPELLHGISRCEVVLQELGRMDSPERFHRSWGYWHVMQEGTPEERSALAAREQETGFIQSLAAKYQLHALLADKLRAAVAHMNAIAARLESDKLAGELLAAGEAFLRPFASVQPVVHYERR